MRIYPHLAPLTSTNSFSTIQPPNGTSPAADSTTDTLTFTSADSTLTITGDSSTDTIDFIINASAETERIQDAIGTILLDSSEIDFTYDDATPTITAVLKTTGVTGAAYGGASQATTFTVDTKGRLTAAAAVAISVTHTSVSDWDSAVQTSANMSAAASAAIGDNQTAQDVSGLLFSSASIGTAFVKYNVKRIATATVMEAGELICIYNGTSWSIEKAFSFGDAGIDFTITAAGQVQYTTDDMVGSYDTTNSKMKWFYSTLAV